MNCEKRIVNNTNNFYGEVNGVQIQQGVKSSSQVQTINNDFDYGKLKEILLQIRKYENMFDEEYGEDAPILRSKLEKIEMLLQKRDNPSKIKLLLTDIKNLSIGVSENLIASGIVALISSIM